MIFKKLNESFADSDIESVLLDRVVKMKNQYYKNLKNEIKYMFNTNNEELLSIVYGLNGYAQWYGVLTVMENVIESAKANNRTIDWVNEECKRIFKSDSGFLEKYNMFYKMFNKY